MRFLLQFDDVKVREAAEQLLNVAVKTVAVTYFGQESQVFERTVHFMPSALR